MKRLLYAILACIGVSALAFSPSHASPITSESLTVYDPLGNIFAQTIAHQGDESGTPATCASGLIVPPDNVGDPPTNVCVFTLPGVPVALNVPLTFVMAGDFKSDVFGVCPAAVCGSNVLSFISNAGFSVPISRANKFIVKEAEPGLYDATQYLSLGLQRQGYRAEFFSTVGVPEPSTLLLLGAGIAGIGGIRLRRIQRI